MKKRSKRSANGVAPIIAAAMAVQPGMHAAPMQDGAQTPPPAAPATEQSIQQSRQSVRVRFNFKGQTYDQILDYFSRTTGLPIVREADVPKGTVDYIYPKDYTLDEALRTLNVLLQTQGVMLRDEGSRLFLQKLDDMKRENVPTFVGQVPANIGDEEIVTIVLPLLHAQAKPVAEQLKGLVATYGSVTALEQQNSVLIVETAAQIRRLQRIIDELDRQDVENVIELIPVRFTKATVVIGSLQALMGERVIEYVIQDGKRQKIEENRVAGLMLAADERTNSIIARGPRAKIEAVRQTIELVDVPIADAAAPTASGGRGMKTFSVEKVKADAAKQRLEQLFAAYPADKKPTIVALPEAERVTVVGDLGSIDDAERFIAEMEGFDPRKLAAQKTGATTRERLRGDRAIAAIELQSASPEAILAAAKSLLSKRQQDEVTLVAGPDGRTVLVGGDSADIAGIRAIVETLDRPANIDRQVRLMRLAGRDGEASLERARRLYEEQTQAADPARSLRIEFDAKSRELVLIGSAQSIARFTELLNQVDATRVVERETRQIAVQNAAPSAIVAQARELARQVLDPRDGSAFTPPSIEAVDAMKALLVTGTPDEVAQVQSLVAGLDRVGRDAFGFRAIPAPGADAARLVERARTIYAQLTKGSESELPEPSVEIDPSSGSLLVSGRTASIASFEQALAQARLLMPPPRTAKIVPMRAARAADVAAKLSPLLASAAPVDPSRSVPAAEIKVIEPTNSLYIVGEAPQIAMIDAFVRDLDIPSPEELPPLRLLQLRGGDAGQVATMLAKRYDERAPEERRAKPVRIEADSTTNTLIVTAHASVFDEIKGFIAELNRAGDTGTGPTRETFVMALKAAKAGDLAIALDRLYPPPPVPLDARGRPLPHLQKPKEVFVAADPTTNSLIVEAPTERRASFEQLVLTLDRTPLPPLAELRTYRIDRGDMERIAQTLRDLAARGMLSKPGVDGAKPVEVVVQTEGQSRTLIVAGDTLTFEKTEQLLKQLQAVPTKRGVRVIDVGAGDAGAILAKAFKLASLEAAEGAAPLVETEIDAANGTIVASGDEEPLARFADACRQLVAATSPSADVRVVPMTYAKAAEAKLYLDGLAASRLGQSAGFAKEPVIEVLERTNSLLVAADSRQHELLAVLLRNLDVQQGVTPPLRILQLRSADASTLAVALMQTYGQRAPEEKAAKPVQITAEAQTNALIVAAHPDMLPEIQQIVEDLNGATRQSASDREIRIFSLKVARAAELAKTIDEMYPQPPVPVDARGRARPELQPPREVVVRSDAQTNSLIVDAPIARMAGFEKLVEQLDRTQAMPESEIRTWRLSAANLEGIAKTIRDLAAGGKFGAEGTNIVVTTEPVSKTLVVSAAAAVFPRIEQVVRGVEGAPQPATTLRVFKLKGAKSETLAPVVRGAVEGRLAEIEPTLAARGKTVLDIAADRRSNALIVSAPDVLMPVVEELIRQLDDGTTAAAGDPVVRVRPLLYADATEVSASLAQALAAATNPATREPIAVKVIPATGSNALLMVGPASDLDEADKLIAPLDERPALDSVDAKTFPLRNADAARIAPLVQKLLADQQDTDPRLALERMRRMRGQSAPVPPVRVESDARTNSLIVSGAARMMSVAEGLIQQLDRDADGAGRSWAVFTPTKAPVTALADEARRILESAGAGGTSRTELSALPQSGTIVIVGSTEGTERAKQVLAELDGKAFAAPQADFKVIQLKHVAPDVVVATLTAVLGDRSRWPASLVSAAKAGAPVMEPKVVADALNARVIVTAPAELMSVAVEVVAQLDRPREGDAPVEIRVYSLSEATADTVAKAIEQAVAARAIARPGRVKPTITPEMTSNSIVVAADPAQLDEIEKTVRDMDVRGPRDAARVRTVFLKKARAGQMAPLVEQLLAAEAAQPSRVRGGGPGSPEPALRVIADERLNAVVISATPTALDAAEEMLKQLDVAPGTESDRTVRVISLRNGDAAEIAKSLSDIFETDEGTENPPVVRVNVASNSLLVRANEKQHAMLETIVSRLDSAALASSRALKSVPLDPSKGDAEEVARLLRRLMQQANGEVEVITVEELLERYDSGAKSPVQPSKPAGPQGRAVDAPWSPGALPGKLVFVGLAFAQAAPAEAPDGVAQGAAESAGVTVAVDKDSNSLLLLGSPREIERAMKLIEQASRSMPGEASRVRSVRLPASADPAKIASVVNGAIARMTPAGGQAGDISKRVAVVADEETRSLIVVAGDRDFEAIGQLIAALARGQTAQQVVVKSFVLRNTGAERVAEALRGILTQGGGKLRSLSVTLSGEEGGGEPASFDPGSVRVFAERGANAVTVIGDSEAVAFADRFVAFADRADRAVVPEVRLVPVRHAKAADVVRSLQTAILARTRALSAQGIVVGMPEFSADERTNMVVIAGGGEMSAEIERLLGLLDAPSPSSAAPLEVIAIMNGKASEALATIEKVVFAPNPALRERAQVVADDGAGVLLLRAEPAAREEIVRVVAEIDRSAARQFAIRQVKLERADAQRVATALQKLFDDRAAIAAGGRPRGSQRAVSIVADVRSASLFVTAGEADFAEVLELVKGFDAPETAKALDFKVFALRHARAGEVASALEQLLATMGTGGADDMVSVRGDEKRNSIVVAGRGDRFAFAEEFIATIDVAPSESEARSVRIYAVANGDVDQIAGLVRDTIGERQMRPWESAQPAAGSRVMPVARSRKLVVRATEAQHREVKSLLDSLDKTLVQEGRQSAVIQVEFAGPAELATTLKQFLDERAAGARRRALVEELLQRRRAARPAADRRRPPQRDHRPPEGAGERDRPPRRRAVPRAFGRPRGVDLARWPHEQHHRLGGAGPARAGQVADRPPRRAGERGGDDHPHLLAEEREGRRGRAHHDRLAAARREGPHAGRRDPARSGPAARAGERAHPRGCAVELARGHGHARELSRDRAAAAAARGVAGARVGRVPADPAAVRGGGRCREDARTPRERQGRGVGRGRGADRGRYGREPTRRRGDGRAVQDHPGCREGDRCAQRAPARHGVRARPQGQGTRDPGGAQLLLRRRRARCRHAVEAGRADHRR